MAGHVALLFEDYATAQEFFLASARPLTALEMRRDLLHWYAPRNIKTSPQKATLISNIFTKTFKTSRSPKHKHVSRQTSSRSRK